MENSFVNDTVWQIATTFLETVYRDTPIEEVQTFFKVNNCHHLPVIELDGSLKGIISSTDLVKVEQLVSVYQKQNHSLKAEDIMTAYPFTLSPTASIMEAMELFLENKFHALPIVEDEKIVGIVTTHDVLKWTMNIPSRVVEQ